MGEGERGSKRAIVGTHILESFPMTPPPSPKVQSRDLNLAGREEMTEPEVKRRKVEGRTQLLVPRRKPCPKLPYPYMRSYWNSKVWNRVITDPKRKKIDVEKIKRWKEAQEGKEVKVVKRGHSLPFLKRNLPPKPVEEPKKKQVDEFSFLF